jgi:hypothetical protein
VAACEGGRGQGEQGRRAVVAFRRGAQVRLPRTAWRLVSGAPPGRTPGRWRKARPAEQSRQRSTRAAASSSSSGSRLKADSTAVSANRARTLRRAAEPGGQRVKTRGAAWMAPCPTRLQACRWWGRECPPGAA